MSIDYVLSNITNYEFDTIDFIKTYNKLYGKDLTKEDANKILNQHCKLSGISSCALLGLCFWQKSKPRPTPRRNPIGPRWSR